MNSVSQKMTISHVSAHQVDLLLMFSQQSSFLVLHVLSVTVIMLSLIPYMTLSEQYVNGKYI